MNISYYIDPRYTYRETIERRYNELKDTGEMDDFTKEMCENIIGEPEPEPFVEGARPIYVSSIPGAYCQNDYVSARDRYELTRIDMIKRNAEWSLMAVKNEFDSLKSELDENFPGMSEKISGVDVDEALQVKVLSKPGALTAEEETALNEFFNKMGDFRKLLLDHHATVLNLIEYGNDPAPVSEEGASGEDSARVVED